MSDNPEPQARDLAQGVPLDELMRDGKIVGRLGDEELLIVANNGKIFAVGAHCSHYHAPLIDGLVVEDALRCPWHHAEFDLETGEATRAPAFEPISCWLVEARDGKVFVKEKRAKPSQRALRGDNGPESIIIVGGGAAGLAAADQLRREGYARRLIMLSAEDSEPLDRPNLSKDYLAGTASEDWLPLRPQGFYADNAIDLRLNAKVASLDLTSRRVELAGGESLSFDRVLLATGAEPVLLPTPGGDRAHVHRLRSLADCQAIIKGLGGATQAVVIGASFIGLEVAAALRTRGVAVHVVAPERRPMERVLGAEIGDFVRALHEEHGVVFHLGDTVEEIGERQLRLKSGGVLDADLVVMGVGVRPRLELAERAGLALDRGVAVNAYLETSAPGVFAVGDIARWPDPHSGENIRVEHWVVAERQGQCAARNMLGRREVFDAAPFFWSQHYDIPINYVGHAESWDKIEIEGDITAKDCLLRYRKNGRTLAVASIFRDLASLEAELAMERTAS